MRTEYTNLLRSLTVIMISLIISSYAQAADIVLGDTTICIGTEAQLEIDGDFETLAWSPSATLSCVNCPNPRAIPTATTTYIATFVESNGQAGTISITVSLPEIKPIADLTICKNTSVVFDAGDDFIGFQYNWEPAELFSCTDCPNPTLLNSAAAGPLTVRYSLSSAICSFVDSFELTILDEDGPIYEVRDDARFCSGDVIDIGGTEDPNAIYSWTSSPAGFVSSLSNPDVTPVVNTSYFLEVSRPGCSVISRDTVHAILTSPALINFGQDIFEICAGDTLSAITDFLPVEDVDYLWSPEMGLEDSANVNTPAFPTSSTTYTLTATKGVCEAQDDVQVNVPISSVNITQDSALVCIGDMLTLTATAQPDANAITWSPASGLDVTTGSTVNITDLRGEFYIYARSVNGICSSVDSVFYRVDSLPADMEILPQDTTICEGAFAILKSPVFEPANFPDIEFEWTQVPGAGFQTGDSLYNMVVSPTDTIDLVRYVTNGACYDSNFVTVNVEPVQDIVVTPADTTVCVGETFQYQVLTQNITDIQWMPATGLSCSDCDDPVATATTSGMYMLSAVDENGCPTMGSANLTAVAPPSIDFRGTGDICPGQIVTLNQTAIPGITYSWTSTDPAFADTNDPTPFAQPANNASYTAVMSGAFCANVTQTINLNIIPPVSLSLGENPTICPGEEAVLNADADGVPGTFTWSTGEMGASITVQPSQTTSYSVTYTNSCQTLSTSGAVIIEDDFNPFISPSPARTQVNLGESIDLNLNTAIPADQIASVMWSENGSAVGTGTTINARPPAEGANEYRAKVTTVNGCMREAIIVIFAVVPSVIIPNAFTPNNDGLNDELNIVRIVGDIEVNSLVIFDRWGNRVYEAADGGWDGTFNGKAMPSDVYVYIAEYVFPDGTTSVQKGEVSLIR